LRSEAMGPRRRSMVVTAGLFVFTFLFYYWCNAHTFVIPSIDGPYYLIEVKGILSNGAMIYADPPLTFYVFALIAAVIRSVESSVIAGSALFAAGTSVAVYILLKSIFKSELPAIGAAIASAVAPEHIALSTNLIKNSVGVLFIVGMVYFLQRTMNPETKMRWNAIGVMGLFYLAMLTHVLDQGVALLFMAGYFVFAIALTKKRLIMSYGSFLLVALLSTVVGYLLFPDYFGDFEKGLVFVSDITSATSGAAAIGGGAPPGGGVSNPLLVLFLGAGLLLTAYEWVRGNRERSGLIGMATVIGALLVLPIIPSDFAWRFEAMEFIPVSIIVGYALASLKGRGLVVLALIILLSPLALLGYQTATSLSPTVSVQGYSELEKMATVVGNRSVLIIEGGGMAYWPQYVLGLPVVTNATQWLGKGYTVYVLVGSQGGAGPGNSGTGAPAAQGPPNQQPSDGGAGPGVGGPGGQGSLPGVSTPGLNTANLTLVYQGSVYSLYKY